MDPAELVADDPGSEGDALIEALDQLEQVIARHLRLTKAAMQPNSVMAADDQATRPFQMSHIVGYSLLQSSDALRTLLRILRDDDGSIIIPVMGAYPVIRSAIESASLAQWLLRPTDRRTRVLRLLQARFAEIGFERSLRRTLFASSGELSPQMRSMAARELRSFSRNAKETNRYLREIARVGGIDRAEYENVMSAWSDIVAESGLSDDGTNHHAALASWQFASGMTHPSVSRSRIATEFTKESEDGDVFHGTIRPRVGMLAQHTVVAAATLERALLTYRIRKAMVNPEHPVATPVVNA